MRLQSESQLVWALLGFLSLSLVSCSSTPKKPVLELSALEGKKVALVGVDAEPTARKIVEVALVNQLVQRGSFSLLPRQDVEVAQSDPKQDPTDWKGIARRAGADYALRATVQKFNADVKDGYSSEEVIDTQLAEEQGTDGKTQRVFKVKTLTGEVQVELKFTNLTQEQTLSGIAGATETVKESQKNAAIHLPPTLRFLEKIANQAFQKFFEKYK